MIRLIRKDSIEILLNSDLVLELVNNLEGTVIKLSNGDNLEVKNTRGDIMQKIDAYNFGLSEERREEYKLAQAKQEALAQARAEAEAKELADAKAKEEKTEEKVEEVPEEKNGNH
ncbi:MAG: flagellar FlbD family protein [bacterium]|nr:flagellar FlbD family protein [bacterium]